MTLNPPKPTHQGINGEVSSPGPDHSPRTFKLLYGVRILLDSPTSGIRPAEWFRRWGGSWWWCSANNKLYLYYNIIRREVNWWLALVNEVEEFPDTLRVCLVGTIKCDTQYQRIPGQASDHHPSDPLLLIHLFGAILGSCNTVLSWAECLSLQRQCTLKQLNQCDHMILCPFLDCDPAAGDERYLCERHFYCARSIPVIQSAMQRSRGESRWWWCLCSTE